MPYSALLRAARGRRYPDPPLDRRRCPDCQGLYDTSSNDPHTRCPACHAVYDDQRRATWDAAGLCLDCGGWPDHGDRLLCPRPRCAPPRCWIRGCDTAVVAANDGSAWGFKWKPLDAAMGLHGCYYACPAHLPLVLEGRTP